MTAEVPGQAQPHSTVETDFEVHAELPTTRPSQLLDGVLRAIGYAFSWLWLAVVGVILVAVIGRYAFATSSVMMEELAWHVSGAAWLIGLSYTLISDHHVRVDVLYERFGTKTKAWIETLGIIVLLLPFTVIAINMLGDFFWSSWKQGEVSNSPGGLPARYVIKFIMLASFGLLAVAAVSRLLKCTALLFGRPRPIRSQSAR